MLTIRPAEWPWDVPVLAAIDTSFTTDRIYRPVREEFSFRLVEEAVRPSLTQHYRFDPSDPAERRNWDFTAIAEADGALAGFAAAQYSAWNRRVALWHLYVMPRYRRQKVGTQLLGAVDDFAHSAQARCVWLETQNTNYPAIQFYRSAGFAFCGFDESLYDPANQEREEVALFFTRPVIASFRRELL
jgi:ribosomal protein S18 acetylase RimI-like enzyme